MSKDLVIVFVKNIKLGKVKTRLAKTIGHQAAIEVYKALLNVTESATKNLKIPIRVYFSDEVIKTKWGNNFKAVQKGSDLGERMKNAFLKGFEDGFDRIVLIGSDLPDINASHILKGLNALERTQVVFGPAVDGGYYLVGMSKMNIQIFENKPWSQSNLLEETLLELHKLNISVSTLDELNDVDTYEDLIASEFYKNNTTLQLKIKQLHD